MQKVRVASSAEGLAESVFENPRDEEPHVYLLPEYAYLSERKGLLDAFWPADRTRELFDKWFEVQINSVIEDFDVDEPLETT